MEAAPDSVLASQGGRNFTAREVLHCQKEVTRHLSELGVRSSERVFVKPHHSLSHFVLLLALLRMNCAVGLLPDGIGTKTKEWLYSLFKPERVLEPAASPDSPPKVLSQTSQESTKTLPTPSITIFTSGSSGLPKGVVHSLSALAASARGSSTFFELDEETKWLVSLPTYHVAGLACIFRSIESGGAFVFPPKMDTATVLDEIYSGHCTHASIVPRMAMELCQERRAIPDFFQFALLGGAECTQNLLDSISALKLPLLPTYGMSEAGSTVTAHKLSDTGRYTGSVGCPLPHLNLQLKEFSGGVGRVSVTGESLFTGYLLEEGFVPHEAPLLTEDLGSLLPNGALQLHGRRDQMFISGGENIHPREIETIALEFPGVTDVAVIAIPDTRWGQRPVLYYTALARAPIKEDELRLFIEQALGKRRAPLWIEQTEEIPYHGIGKVDRAELQARAKQDTLR